MSPSNTIHITVSMNTTAANASIGTLNLNIGKIGTATQQASNQAQSGFNGISASIDKTSRAVAGLTSALAGMAAIRMGAALFSATDEINKSRIALTTMTGSAETAVKTLAAIREVAKTAPFRFPELLEMTQRLKAFGFEAGKLPRMVTAISNAAAALGKGKSGIDSITLALGQMKAKGIVQGQELFRQLAEQGILAGEYVRKGLEKELGRSLDMTEFRRMIEKGIVQSGPAIDLILKGMEEQFGKVGVAMADLVTVRFQKLLDALLDLGMVITKDLGPPLIWLLGQIQSLVEWFTNLPKPIRILAETLFFLATALTAVNIALTAMKALGAAGLLGQIGKLVGALGTLRLAINLAAASGGTVAWWQLFPQQIAAVTAALGPLLKILGLVGLAIAAINLGSQIWEEMENTSKEATDAMQKAFKTREQLALQAEALEKKLIAGGAKDIGYGKSRNRSFMSMDIDQIKEHIAKLNTVGEKMIGQNKELMKHQMEIAQQALDRALAKSEGAIFGIYHKYAGLFRELVGAPSKAIAMAQAAAAADMTREKEKFALKNKDLLQKQVEEERKVWDKQLDYHAKLYQQALEYRAQTEEIYRQTLINQGEFEQTIAEQEKDQKLANLDVVKRQTLAQEIVFQQQSAAIQIEAADKILQNKLDMEDKRYQHELANIQAIEATKLLAAKSEIERKQISQDARDREAAEVALSGEKMRQMIILNEYEIARIRLNSNKAINNAVIEEQKKIYDKLKSSLGSVFDALLHKSTSVWEAIANGMKTAIIGAIKEIVTSRAAAALMQMFGYGQVSFGGGPRGLGGQQPTFGGQMGGGAGGILATALGLGMPRGSFGTPGSPGGTSGFSGPVGIGTSGALYSPAGGGAAGVGGATGAAGSPVTGLAAASLGLKGLFGVGAGTAAKFGGGAAGTAAGALTSPAAGIAGALLMMSGWKRGGAGGLAMMAGGGWLAGASIGMLVGGPIGAGIGALVGTAVGLVAGTIRLFIKSSDQKLREKIKAVYQIDLADKGVRTQILQLTMQKYGGNMDMAVRSPEVQALIQLYAMSTGQNAMGMPRPMYGATFAQSGAGGLALQPVYQNGQAVASPYSGTTTTQWQQGGLYVQLNPQQANDLFEGRVVNVIDNNPDRVSQASASGARAGTSRDAQRSALFEPLTVVR